MSSEQSENERLLKTDEELPRVASSRFQVTQIEHPLSPLEKSASEPPSQITVERKTSSTGRFVVTNQPESELNPLLNKNNEPEEYTAEEGEHPVNNYTTRMKGVQFSVGESEDRPQRDQDGANTINMKSWRHMKTIEHPPIMDFYRNSVDFEGGIVRPSMAQLIHGHATIDEEIMDDFQLPQDDTLENSETSPRVQHISSAARVKFGWITGVFNRCLLNIFGVMLYLRIGWVAGQAGILLGSCIVLLASAVTTITALSTCAICTNGDVKGGGAYFLISRSLGPDYGGSIGIIFSIANAVGGAMYIVGFAETVRDIMRENGMMILDGELWDIRVIGLITCLILVAIIFLGTEFESKMQTGLLVVLLASIANYAIGSVFPPDDETMRRGATGYSFTTMSNNLIPQFRGEDFFSVFSVYFPAATGIMAGANISGDLQSPQKAIPKGTLLAILCTTSVYLGVIWSTGSTFVRDADGIDYPFFNGTTFVPPACAVNGTCEYGLMNYFQVMESSSLFGFLITLGIFAATLSSALASLVSAPKVFQAVCKDNLFPYINIFAKSYGPNEEPRRAYFLCAIICFGVCLIGELNAIAPIISNFFLASYALINYACFDNSFANSPGFRPGFKYYNQWVSLAGALLCVLVMFIIDWVTALLTLVCFAILFMYIRHRKPDVNWGSSSQAHSLKNAVAALYQLSRTNDHIKTYRPQFLVLTGNPAVRSPMVDFVTSISKSSSLVICGFVAPSIPHDRYYSAMKKIDRELSMWIAKNRYKCFYSVVANKSLREGAQSLLQICGIGRLRPNVVLLGFKSNWYINGPTPAMLSEINEYFGTLQDSFEIGMAVCILRNQGYGLDFSAGMAKVPSKGKQPNFDVHSSAATSDPSASYTDIQTTCDETTRAEDTDGNRDRSSDLQKGSVSSNSLSEPFAFENVDEEETTEDLPDDEEIKSDQETDQEGKDQDGKFSLLRRSKAQDVNSVPNDSSTRRETAEQRALKVKIDRFKLKNKIKQGIIDVYWLFDDGGLALLIPHLLSQPPSFLEGARLRIFTIAVSSSTMEQEHRKMAALLNKFRIDFADLCVITDMGKRPKQENVNRWQELINPWIAPDGANIEGMTTQAELIAQKDKTYRQIRTREVVQQKSMDSDLVIITLPVPRKGLVSASLYLSWLDMMTRDMPPTLLVRGNQTSVLTFYS